MEMTIKIEGYEAEQLAESAVSQLRKELQEKIAAEVRDAVEGRVADEIDSMVRNLTEERLRTVIDGQIAEGWPNTNTYGERVGPDLTLKDRIAKQLDQRDPYNGQKRLVDKILEEKVVETLRGEFGKELEAAKANLRALLDDTVKTKLAEAIKQTFGISLR